MLHDAGIPFEELVLNHDLSEATIRTVCGTSTVPQVFINGDRIGDSKARGGEFVAVTGKPEIRQSYS